MGRKKMGLTYAGSGVNYDAMDPFKKMCQLVGLKTASQLQRHGCIEMEWSRGESCYIFKTPWGVYMAHVEEGLGTKNIAADKMANALALWQGVVCASKRCSHSFYREVAQCNVAMVINDLITSGASPLNFMLHLAVGNGDWFKNEQRAKDISEGTAQALILGRCAWGGGETPGLKGIILPDEALLSGSAVGFIEKEEHVINPANICDGDAIVFFQSSGPHANGFTMLREIADGLPSGYLAQLPSGRTYGDTILAPTHIYAAAIQECQKVGVRIHYAINVTGHGWRKLMRANANFSYIIDRLPPQQEIFDFVQKVGDVSDREMYKTFNMGAVFALYLPQEDLGKLMEALMNLTPEEAVLADVVGHIEASKEKKVVIVPKDITFDANDLDIR
jgi:phosphoribosylformylglycinamidine cyclo-ligase